MLNKVYFFFSEAENRRKSNKTVPVQLYGSTAFDDIQSNHNNTDTEEAIESVLFNGASLLSGLDLEKCISDKANCP